MSNDCIACGMPMEKPEHFALGDTTKDFCIHCVSPDGTMHTWEEKVESMALFLMKTRGLSEDDARQAAEVELKKLPHWQE